MKIIYLLILAAITQLTAHGQLPTSFRLGQELLKENLRELAAIEFRRFALETADPTHQAAAWLHAGYAYLQTDQLDTATTMLEHAEALDANRYSTETTLLYGELARLERDADSALYFYELLAGDQNPSELRTLAHRRSAALQLKKANYPSARQQLQDSPADETRSLQALETYLAGKDKNPKLGGLLGLIPGLGYAYSGEYANGLRCLILNSLFIYGMANTAEKDQWGAFSVITFFELTWYSGSIYGGIDAAHRHNRDRLQTALDQIEGSIHYRPDPDITLPLFKLRIEF